MTQITTTIDDYFDSIAKGNKSGNYRSNAKYSIEQRFLPWLAANGITDLDQLSTDVFRDYAHYMATLSQGDDGEIKPTTARTYFRYVSSFSSWCWQQEHTPAHYAGHNSVTDQLPDEQPKDRQVWDDEKRSRLLEVVDQRATHALEQSKDNLLAYMRDNVLFHLLAYGGVETAEIVNSSKDSREGRSGLTWEDVNFDAGTIKVLGRSQETESINLGSELCDMLQTYYRIQNPPIDDWIVFETGHTPTRKRTATEGLESAGFTSEEVDYLLDAHGIDVVLRDLEVSPPAISCRGTRNRLKNLCKDYNITIDGEPLKTFGARRKLGNEVFDESVSVAQNILRNKSIQSVQENYPDPGVSTITVDDAVTANAPKTVQSTLNFD